MAFCRRAVCLVLALCVPVALFCACSEPAPALSYGSQTLSERLYTYTLMLQKTKTLSALTGTVENLEDSEAIWQTTDQAGQSFGEKLLQSVYDEACVSLFYRDYAAKNGITPDERALSAAKKNADNVVAAFSSRSDFDRYMKTYDADYQLILDYYNDLAKTEAGMKAYYSAPVTALTPADCRAYFREHFLTCRYFYISLASRTLPNGKTAPMSAEDLEAARADLALLYDALLSQKELAPELIARVEAFSFADGSTKTVSVETLPEKLSQALFSAPDAQNPGVYRFETDDGVFLIERRALDETQFDALSDEIYTGAVSEREQALLAEHKDEFSKNQAFFDALDILTTPIFSD